MRQRLGFFRFLAYHRSLILSREKEQKNVQNYYSQFVHIFFQKMLTAKKPFVSISTDQESTPKRGDKG